MKILSDKEIVQMRMKGKKLATLKPVEPQEEPEQPNEIAVALENVINGCEKMIQINAATAIQIVSVLADIKNQKPEPVIVKNIASPSTKKWRFDIKRDGRGFIEAITATQTI